MKQSEIDYWITAMLSLRCLGRAGALKMRIIVQNELHEQFYRSHI